MSADQVLCSGPWGSLVLRGDAAGTLDVVPPAVTLRDLFAAAVLPALMRAGNHECQESLAEECYEIADALLDARRAKGAP